LIRALQLIIKIRSIKSGIFSSHLLPLRYSTQCSKNITLEGNQEMRYTKTWELQISGQITRIHNFRNNNIWMANKIKFNNKTSTHRVLPCLHQQICCTITMTLIRYNNINSSNSNKQIEWEDCLHEQIHLIKLLSKMIFSNISVLGAVTTECIKMKLKIALISLLENSQLFLMETFMLPQILLNQGH